MKLSLSFAVVALLSAQAATAQHRGGRDLRKGRVLDESNSSNPKQHRSLRQNRSYSTNSRSLAESECFDGIQTNSWGGKRMDDWALDYVGTNNYYFTCDWYAGYEGACKKYGTYMYTGKGYTANEVCCACGGGFVERTPSPEPEPEPESDPLTSGHGSGAKYGSCKIGMGISCVMKDDPDTSCKDYEVKTWDDCEVDIILSYTVTNTGKGNMKVTKLNRTFNGEQGDILDKLLVNELAPGQSSTAIEEYTVDICDGAYSYRAETGCGVVRSN